MTFELMMNRRSLLRGGGLVTASLVLTGCGAGSQAQPSAPVGVTGSDDINPRFNLKDVLDRHVSSGAIPGAVALVAYGNRIDVQAVGSTDGMGTSQMARDSIFRLASITKPITAAAAMMLVEDKRIALEDPISEWLPELAAPNVVRFPTSPIDDVVPAVRPITVADLLTSRSGWGFPPDFSLPAAQLLVTELKQGPPRPQQVAAPDEWIATLSRIPLLHQPGDAFLYNTSYDILGVLIARVADQELHEFLAERLFEPLGMVDTGFAVPPGKIQRFVHYYRTETANILELADAPDGQWSSAPVFLSGAGGLVSTVDDWHAFARMLLAQGIGNGIRLLSPMSVRRMMTDHLTLSQRNTSTLYLEGQGWGFGGSVDIRPLNAWNVPGRYGWVGGTGTAAHVIPSFGMATILLTQLELDGPTPPPLMRDFWRCAAEGYR